MTKKVEKHSFISMKEVVINMIKQWQLIMSLTKVIINVMNKSIEMFDNRNNETLLKYI